MTTLEIICFKIFFYLNSVGFEGGSGVELESSTLFCGFSADCKIWNMLNPKTKRLKIYNRLFYEICKRIKYKPAFHKIESLV